MIFFQSSIVQFRTGIYHFFTRIHHLHVRCIVLYCIYFASLSYYIVHLCRQRLGFIGSLFVRTYFLFFQFLFLFHRLPPPPICTRSVTTLIFFTQSIMQKHKHQQIDPTHYPSIDTVNFYFTDFPHLLNQTQFKQDVNHDEYVVVHSLLLLVLVLVLVVVALYLFSFI